MMAGPMSVAVVTRMALQLGSALEYMHSTHAVHHDIKPFNVMVCEKLDLKANLDDQLMKTQYKVRGAYWVFQKFWNIPFGYDFCTNFGTN